MNMKCVICGKEIGENEAHVKGKDGCVCSTCMAGLGQLYLDANGIKIPEQTKNSDGIVFNDFSEVPKPKEIKDYLDQYVIGQDDAKEDIAIGVYNHYKRILNKNKTDEVELGKSNILVLGNSGTGKTFIAKTIAKFLKVPFTIADSTSLSQAGYVGDDVESIITRLLLECDYDVKKAEKGIVFLDEIDKIARKGDNPSISRDVSGEGVQQGLLKLIEGNVVFCPPDPGRKHPEKPVIPVDTSDILFVCAGAFEGIEKRIAKRMNSHAVGFEATARRQEKGNKDEDLLKYVASEDVRAFGLIPEIVGRLPIITHTNPLQIEDLERILKEPKNSLVKQYQKMLEIDGVKVEFTDDALDEMAKKAIEKRTGARGLRSIMEKVMKRAMFDLPGGDTKELTIDAEYVKNQLNCD